VKLRRALAVKRHELFGRHVELAEQHAVAGVAPDERTQLREQLVQARLIPRVLRQLTAIRQLAGPILGVHRVVAPLRVLEEQRRRIEPEAVDAAIEPELQRVEHRRPHLRLAPVQVRL